MNLYFVLTIFIANFVGMNKLIHIFILLLVAITANFHVAASDYESNLSAIDRAISREDWLSADSLIIATMRSDPGNPGNIMLLSNLGMIRFYQGNDSLALSTLDQAQAMAPNSVSILANRARVNTAIGDIEAALADYNRIEHIDSLFPDTYINRGVIYLYSGLFELAEKDLEIANKLAPDRLETNIALASFYSITSQSEHALEYYTKLIRTKPEAEYYAARAMCLLELDRLPEAAEDIASGIELDPDYGELYLARAVLNKKSFERDASLADAQRAITLGANPERVKLMLGL